MTLSAIALDSPAHPWVFVAWFGCLCGIYVFGQGLLLLRRRKKTAAPAKIRDAKPRPILVSGLAEGATTLYAAVSGKPCFYYRTTLRRQEDPAGDDSWEIVADEIRGMPFVLNDKTGKILVDPRGAEVDLVRDLYEEYGKTLLATYTDVPPALELFVKQNSVETTAALRVEEYLLPPGAEIFVYGFATANPALQSPKAPTLRRETAPRDSGGKNAAPLGLIAPQVIHLSPETQTRPAGEMTMQSRVAAALALARVRSSDSSDQKTAEKPPQNPLHIPSMSVAVTENAPGNAEAHAQPTRRATEVSPAAAPSQTPPPPLVLRQQDGARFTISYRTPPPATASSIRRATALLLAGPLITLASAYYLLANLGLL